MEKIRFIIHFLRTDIWQIGRKDVTRVQYYVFQVIKKLLLAVEWFTAKRMFDHAAALTYSTLLAVVPISAVVFAIARGFGYNRYIETWFRETFSSQPQAADAIVGFVNSYLIHTKSGVIFGIGLLFMIWTVVMLTSNIEKSFNDIWQVSKPRSIYRTFADYLAMFILVPVFIVISSSLSILMATVAHELEDYYLIGSMARFAIGLTPYLLTSGAFIALYVFMPNTKVRVVNAIIPGILAGVAMQMLQFFYIHSQIWVSGYNAIYGSFAALPLFMLWLQISWTICLFGAELCYTSQNLEEYAFRARTEDLPQRYRILLSAVLMSHICRRFDEGRPAYTALQLKLRTDIPIRITHDLLNRLVAVKLLSEVTRDAKGQEPVYQPAEAIEHISIGLLLDRLESDGQCRFDLDMHQFCSPQWRQVLENHAAYIDRQRKILLKDIPDLTTRKDHADCS